MWWGILRRPSPIRGGGRGHCGWWGGIVVVGWHGDGRAGAVMLSLPSNVGVPPSVYAVVLLNGGVWCV